MKRKATEKARFHCRFQLPGSVEAFGDLRARGQDTVLRLTSDAELPYLRGETVLTGSTLDGRKITCIDCVRLSQGTASQEQVTTHHFAEIFPNYVVIGREHLDPSASILRNVQFEVTDISSLFYDFDAFGTVLDAGPIMDSVLAERRRLRPVEVGEWPRVAYFTGKFTVIEVVTDIGRISVNHRLSGNLGGPEGVFIKNRMFVLVEPASAITFHEAIDRILVVRRFLSIVAGRQQGITEIQVGTTSFGGDVAWSPLEVNWSHVPRIKRSELTVLRPHPADIPLDPIHRPNEFAVVLKDWIAREKGWRIPRSRYLDGLSKGTFYNADRLISAANMFDILPAQDVPSPTVLPTDLANAQSECLTILGKLSPSQDRDRAISELKRLGKPSLPKKVLHRAAIVEKHFGKRFPELSLVLKFAVKYRNYLVHGDGGDDFDIEAVEPFIVFLTDTLEFVFSASDLIQAGWNVAEWIQGGHATGHTFTRFLHMYREALEEFKGAMG